MLVIAGRGGGHRALPRSIRRAGTCRMQNSASACRGAAASPPRGPQVPRQSSQLQGLKFPVQAGSYARPTGGKLRLGTKFQAKIFLALWILVGERGHHLAGVVEARTWRVGGLPLNPSRSGYTPPRDPVVEHLVRQAGPLERLYDWLAPPRSRGFREGLVRERPREQAPLVLRVAGLPAISSGIPWLNKSFFTLS